MGKGVLLEMAGREAVVLTPQGEFRRVPAPQGSWEIGDEVEFADARPAAAPWGRWAAVAAAAAVMVLAPLGWQSYSLAQPAAIVTVDINPSLRLTLNKKDQVLKAEALNSDGALVLEGVQWKRQPVDQVVTAVTTQAVAKQKLSPAEQGGAVVVGVVPIKQDLPKAQADRIRDKAYAAVEAVAPETNLAVVEVTAKEKAEAEAVGLNPGKFVLFKTIEEQGLPVKAEDLLKQGVGSYLKAQGINPGDIFSEAEKKHGGGPAAKSKEKSKSESDDQPAAPANGKADDKEKDADKSDNKGDKKDENKDDKKNENSGKGNSNSGSGSEKGNGSGMIQLPGLDLKAGEPRKDEPKKDEPKKDEPKRDEPKKDEPKKDEPKKEDKNSWTIPVLNITIEKPAFLRDKSTSETDGGQSPAAEAPRAETPGAGGAGSEKQGNGAAKEKETSSDKESKQKEQEKEPPGQNGKGKSK